MVEARHWLAMDAHRAEMHRLAAPALVMGAAPDLPVLDFTPRPSKKYTDETLSC